MGHLEAARKILQAGREFHRRGWVLGTSGNFSAVIEATAENDPVRIAITESSADKGNLNVEQILLIDGKGQVIEPHGAKPSAETQVHLAVVRRTGAGSVLHTHSVWSTLLSDRWLASRGFPIEGYEMLKGLAGVNTHEHREWVPILANTQDMTALAAEVDALLLDRPEIHGLLIHRHGLYTWGKTIEEAVRHVEIFEFLMEVLWRSFEFQTITARSAASTK
jgi:methylthioribulose-1-phosphate dehydratase